MSRMIDMKRAPAVLRSTPWGAAQSIEDFGDGVAFVSTASHGGFHTTPEVLARIPEDVRASRYRGNPDSCWWEEDQDWAWLPVLGIITMDDDDVERARAILRFIAKPIDPDFARRIVNGAGYIESLEARRAVASRVLSGELIAEAA
jgi:hypothetical protein